MSSSTALAQMPLWFEQDGWNHPSLVYLIQGERRRLANDFVAQLDGDTLRISLESRGLVNTAPNDDLLVSLIQPPVALALTNSS